MPSNYYNQQDFEKIDYEDRTAYPYITKTKVRFKAWFIIYNGVSYKLTSSIGEATLFLTTEVDCHIAKFKEILDRNERIPFV